MSRESEFCAASRQLQFTLTKVTTFARWLSIVILISNNTTHKLTEILHITKVRARQRVTFTIENTRRLHAASHETPLGNSRDVQLK